VSRPGQFLLQMAGDSASGKSSLARAIGEKTGAVVLDKDVIKSAALNAGAVEDLAAPLSYEVLFDVTRSILGQRFSVVVDSPAFFTLIRDKGRPLAEEASASYFIIFCLLSDEEEMQRRLESRERLASQLSEIQLADYSRPGQAPLSEPHLIIDTSRHDEG
jgi:predicted kinase